MIRFVHDGRSVTLEAGQTYQTAVSESYRDAPGGELRALAAEVESGTPWRDAVRQRYGATNPWLASIVTDPSRDLFFREHLPAPGACVLDIGSGWGQLALPLARSCQVTALEPTPERMAFARAAAVQEGVAGSMHFIQADFFKVDFESAFDLAACIGVLEWVPKFREGDPETLQIEFLRRAGKALVPGGRLVIGIENRLGLKYLLGARDDHLGVPHVAVFDHVLAESKWRALTGKPLRSRTHTRTELANLVHAAGMEVAGCYAAFPDYKLPQKILPAGSPVDQFFAEGSFVAEHDGIDGTHLSFQAELQSHYRALAAMGIATEFAPSYFLVAQAPGK